MDANSLNPEALLQHRDFLRALARQLLRDEHLAEDVVQESFLVALVNPPKSADALRSWLAKVVTRRAANRHRGDSRRQRREGEAARAERLPDASEVSESLHTQRRVLAAIEALPDHYRTAIYLRFHEGLPPREIARRMDVPVETIRSRVQRGLAHMRRDLDQEFGGRESWAIVLLPFAGSGREFTSLGWAALAAGVVLSLTLAVAWSWRPASIAPNALHPAETMRRARGGLPVALERGTRSPRDSGEPSRTLDLRSTRHSLLSATGGETGAFADLADPIGPSFELDLTLPAGVSEAELVAELFVLDEVPGTPGPRRTRSIGTSRVHPGAMPWVAFDPLVPLSLTEAGGRSVGALRVSSAEGRHGALVRVHALNGAYPVPVSITLEPRGSLRVALRDETGLPLDDALVSLAKLDADPLEFRMRSDEDGLARFLGFAEGPWRLRVSLPGFEVSRTTCGLVSGESLEERVVLERLPTMRITGKLWSRVGEELEPLPMRLRSLEDPSRLYLSTPVDMETDIRTRSFTFVDVPEGEYVLLPPLDSPFAWEPASRVITCSEHSADFERQDGVATRSVRVRAFDARTGAQLSHFSTIFLVDRFGQGVRAAAELELGLKPRPTEFDGASWSPHAIDLPVHWLVECEGFLAVQGDESEFRRDGDDWLLEVSLDPAWRATFWAGTLDERGRRISLEGVRLVTHAGRELGRTLGDGFLHLDLSYDPGRLRVEAEGWSVRDWSGFWRGRPKEPLDLYEVWLEPAD